MIVEKVAEYRKSKNEINPCYSNWASRIGHPCLRYLVYCRVKNKERLLPDPTLLSIFAEGHIHEDATIRLLQDAGFTILEQQRPFSWDEYQITGHIDGKILVNGDAYPFDVKSMSANIWPKINSVEDMTKSGHWWVRQYPWQLLAYILMDSKNSGLFITKNKGTGQLKEIWMDLDYELGEQLIKKAEAINKHVAEKTLPKPEVNDEICPRCDFRHICLPDIKMGPDLEIVNDDELISLLNRKEELKPVYSEYEKIQKILKKKLNGKTNLTVGDWLITGKWIETKGHTVDPGGYWKSNIVKI